MNIQILDLKKVLTALGFSALAGLTASAFAAVTVPDAPTIGAATAGSASASIAFTAPSSNGGSTITGYTASCVTGSTTKTGTATKSPITVSSLTNGSTFSCTVKAKNAKGSSVASGAVSVTPAAITVPDAPTIGAATAGSASASIAFTAPTSNGGSTITGYTAACVTGSTTKTGTATKSSITVSSLTNGLSYSCKVTAKNAKGSSVASSAVLVTPSSVPGAPKIGTATAGNASASIAFTAPTSNGGSTITGYTASCVTGSTTKTGTATSSPITVSSLTNGLTYRCTVKATNANGNSVASSSASVAPSSITVPGAPTIGTATAGSASASIAFTAPTSNGGSSITGYTASCVNGSTTKTGTATSSPITVSSLTNGKTYSCTVTAKNAKGSSVASSAVSVTPAAATVPGAPTIGAATAGSGTASIAFTAPTSNGGSTITGYTASCVTGSTTKTGTATSSPITVSSLTNGSTYSCTVKATNAIGSSVASSAVSVTPISTTSTASYSTPANFETLVAKSYAGTPTLSSAVANRGYYMISNAATASTASSYATIGSTYSATTGYTLASGTLASTSTYKDYLTKTMQLVTAADGYYRIDSYMHPNNSMDWGGSLSSPTLKFVNNFGKTSTTGNGYVTFAVVINASTKVATLQAKNRYTYATTTATVNGSTVYTGTYTKDSSFAGSGYYVNLTSGTYALKSTATSFYLYTTPLSLGMPSFMNPKNVAFVTNGPAPFLSKVTTTSVENTSTGIYAQVNSTYKSQVAAVGTNTATKTAATTMLAAIKAAVEANGEKLRYSTDVYTAYRDAALATKLVSDTIADGTPGQNLVPYVYFTNEYATSSTGVKSYHPFMVVVSYGNQASPNGLKDVPHPPGSSGADYKDATVTRYSNLENYVFMIPMKDYGQVSDVTTNKYPSGGTGTAVTKNLWINLNSTTTPNVYTWADTTDNGILIDGSVIFPTYNNSLVPSHLAGELSASGCHVGQGGGGPHCHADGYQSGQGLTLYNDTDYVGKTHPPLLGFGYDGVALFGRYRTTTDSALLGYNTLDSFGGHNHDAIGYHYHAHTVSNHVSTDAMGATSTADMYPLMKGAYIGSTNNIPFFRTGDSFTTNKYMGGTVK